VDTGQLSDLKPDPENARAHNPRNVGMIEDALHEIGAARSIVVDEDDVVLAGNATVEAAAAAGIERVVFVDADGETLVAVRRRNLTPEQKRRLALYDNRTAELATWDLDRILALSDGDVLDGLFSDDEIEWMLDGMGVPDADDWAGAMGALPDGDKSPFEQMTFTLHTAQADVVRAALKASKDAGEFGETGNGNSNGNALARICESYVG
jgi:ParB family chromosome partitioning protein